MDVRTVWLTGLSGAGKSTLAAALHQRLSASGVSAYVLDGDVVRTGLCRDLGFSADDRSENIRRVAEVAKLLNAAGVTVIAALISPYRRDREMARQIIGQTAFVETHISTPLEVCASRDPKGLYRKARSGEIARFTGVSDVYEEPEAPALRLNTAHFSIDDCVTQLVDALRASSSR